MGRAGSTRLEGVPGGRQAGRLATEEGIYLEGREDTHVPAEGDPVIVSEIQFGPTRETEVRQRQGFRENPGPVPGTSPVRLHSPLLQSQWASANTYWAAPEPLSPGGETEQASASLSPRLSGETSNYSSL